MARIENETLTPLNKKNIAAVVEKSECAKKPMACQEVVLKVVLIGDSGVGKTNLVKRFTKNTFSVETQQTVGFEFAGKSIRVGKCAIKAQIWDTAGQERFQSLTAAYYRNAVGALVVYDISNRESFEHIGKWLQQIQEHGHENMVLVLVGNKSDTAHLPESRQVSTLEAARFAEKNRMDFIETSALDATNVTKAFKKIIAPVGRLLSPESLQNVVRLPPGWRRVSSRTRVGEFSYQNQYTKERIAFPPKMPAKPSQNNFQIGHGVSGGVGITVTKEALGLKRNRNSSSESDRYIPDCTVCACAIL